MSKIINTELTNLDLVTSSIVDVMGKVGLFHYNKLTYLFEYFFIKNFGERYTKEYFIKLPHGPVISNYKKQINKLFALGLVNVDFDNLNYKRAVDDYSYDKVLIEKSEQTKIAIIPEENVMMLLKKIINLYGNLNTKELEQIVYQTKPIKNYINAQRQGKKKSKGGYILKDCIKLSEYRNIVTEGRKIALKHIQENPSIDFNLQNEVAKELSDLEKLRPQVGY